MRKNPVKYGFFLKKVWKTLLEMWRISVFSTEKTLWKTKTLPKNGGKPFMKITIDKQIFWHILQYVNFTKEENVVKGGVRLRIGFLYGRSVLNLPAGAAAYLSAASAEELRVLIASAKADTAEGVAKALGISEDAAIAALRFWEKNGVLLLEGGAEPAPAEREVFDTRPSYTGADIARICEDGDVKELIDVCSAIFGKTFTPTETESIIYLYDGLSLDFEYIVRLCKYCHDISKPSLRYMEKVGISLYDSGAVTVGALEAYIEKEERKNDMEYRIRSLFGIGERALTPSEKNYISAWTVDWNLPFEVIEMAYNEMMRIKDRPLFSYQNGILKKWVENGCKTTEDVAAYIAGSKKASEPVAKKEKDAEKKKNIGFDLDKFFEAALLRGDETETDS